MFAGTKVQVWQVQKLRIPFSIFSWLDHYWELHGIYFHDGQIWKVVKGNDEKINDIKVTYFFKINLQGVASSYNCYLAHLKALYNYVTKTWCYYTIMWQKHGVILVFIVQLFNRNSKTNKNIRRKIEFREAQMIFFNKRKDITVKRKLRMTEISNFLYFKYRLALQLKQSFTVGTI